MNEYFPGYAMHIECIEGDSFIGYKLKCPYNVVCPVVLSMYACSLYCLKEKQQQKLNNNC